MWSAEKGEGVGFVVLITTKVSPANPVNSYKQELAYS